MKLELVSPLLRPETCCTQLLQQSHSVVCDLDLNTSDSAACEAHATHLQESTPETHGLCTD